MKTVQVALDDNLLSKINQASQQLKTSRSEVIRLALRDFLQREKIRQLEQKMIEGYTRFPQQPEEVEEWLDEQAWEDV